MPPAVQPGNVTGPALAFALLRHALFGLGGGVWRGRLRFALSFFRFLLLLLLLALAFFELIVGLGHVACFLADGRSPYHQSKLAGVLRGLTKKLSRPPKAGRLERRVRLKYHFSLRNDLLDHKVHRRQFWLSVSQGF